MRPLAFLGVILGLSLLLLQGCTCCVYYNHMFNAERAWEEGNTLQKSRHDSLPTDTTWVVTAERAKYDRVIEKCSRVLERFPDDAGSKPRAVFLIAESFRKKGEWTKAVTKYDEFERYFADDDSMPAVEYQRAFCLFHNGDYAVSRFALDRVLAKGETHPYYPQSLQLLSLLEEHSAQPDLAIAALEKVLAGKSGTPFLRGKMHLRLAELYFNQKDWKKAWEHYRAEEVKGLDLRDRIVAAVQGVECLANLGEFPKAIAELDTFERNKDFETQKSAMMERRGELLLLDGKADDGLNLILAVVKKYPKTEPSVRGWYTMGDFEQSVRKHYSVAMQHYDSAWVCWPSSEWGKKAKIRRDALGQLVQLQLKRNTGTGSPISSKEEFQIAELFLFRLSEVDSAVHVLDRMVSRPRDSATSTAADSAVLARAYYARAFIYGEFKKDTLHADSLYKDIVTRFPGTQFAKQAQANMGVRITAKTREDQAHDLFLHAESLWVAISDIPVDSMALVDTAFAHALNAYDSVASTFPGTDYAAKALYASAWLLENQGGQLDSARARYDVVRNTYGNSQWGQAALAKVQPRLRITDQELDRLRRRLEQNSQTNDRMRKQYEEEQKRQLEADRKKRDEDPNVDEVLQNDYNSLYDFQ